MLEADQIAEESLGNLTNQLNNWLGEIVSANVLPDVESLDHFDVIGDLDLTEAAAEVGPQSPYIFGETFALYYLDIETIQSSDSLDKDLSGLARPAHRRYHQLRFQGRPIAYAHSIPEGDEVCQLIVSGLAADVQNAMKWLDDFEASHERYAGGPAQVRMLEVPAYNVIVFWIFAEPTADSATGNQDGESAILVISSPKWMDRLKNQLLDTNTFLRAFAEESPITGLGNS